VQRDAETVPAPTRKNPAAQPFLGCHAAARRNANARLFVDLVHGDRGGGLSRPAWANIWSHLLNAVPLLFLVVDQTAKPCPKREIHRHVKFENKPAEHGDSCKPGENGPKKSQPSDVPEQEITKPGMTRIFPRKPNCRDERRESDPAKPGLIERRKTACAKKSAGNRCQPGPKPQRFE